VTFDAGFKIRLVEAGHIHGSVRIVAVSTLHRTLGHTMMNGQGELSLNSSVPTKAECRLGLLQQAVVQPRESEPAVSKAIRLNYFLSRRYFSNGKSK
jgi:hypothetical protein